MLTVTPAASAAVAAILETRISPAGAGLRLELGLDAAGEQGIGITIVSEPGPGDELVSAAPNDKVFLAPENHRGTETHTLPSRTPLRQRTS